MANENEHIYKVGKTKQENLFNFPHDSNVLLCKDCDNKQKRILKEFREKFIHRKDIGLEYFGGDPNNMIDIILQEVINLFFFQLKKTIGKSFINKFFLDSSHEFAHFCA
jgi:hypothetical protein